MLKRIRFIPLFRIAPILFSVVADIPAFFRMCKSLISGSYRNVSRGTVFKLFFALCYLFFFVDMIPDFIPFVGWVDDLAVLAWVINSLKEEIRSFRQWEVNK